MTIQAMRDQELENKLIALANKVVVPAAQAKIRKEILSIGELGQIKELLYSDVGDDELEFARGFDFNGRNNMVQLARIRDVGERRIVLDMGFEVGFLLDADYRRYLRQLESDSSIRSSIALNYAHGQLALNGKIIGKVQERTNPTKMQVVLQMFQDQGWPTTISAPSGWDDANVGNVCHQLRKRFGKFIEFREGESGTAISYEIKKKVKPK